MPGNDKYQGAYGLAGYVVNGFYSGIRRAPYSTDFAKNAFTLKHISDGTATPDGADGASNSEVHNAGEIWANQMWECYVGLLNDPRHSFAEAQSRMKDYIIGGLKMTVMDATYVEARDAILSVVLATDFKDYKSCSDGFAKRGSGLNAVAPARDSTDLVGVTEDYTPFVCALPNTIPVALLSFASTTGTAPFVASVTVAGTDSDAGDSAVSYSLDYGDGTPAITDQTFGGSTTLSHTYSTAGSYTATLTVKDSTGAISLPVSVPVTVNPPATGSSSGASSSGASSSGGGSSSGGSTPEGAGRFGGSLNLLLLLPMLGFGLRRRRAQR